MRSYARSIVCEGSEGARRLLDVSGSWYGTSTQVGGGDARSQPVQDIEWVGE